MEKFKKQFEEISFSKALIDCLSGKNFIRFDTFIIGEMGYRLGDAESEYEVRKKAFQEFRKRTDKYEFSSYPTMKKWFGIGGYSKPRRERVYEICFSLHVDTKKAETYLTRGLGEPSFQMNDYGEVIYLYGLENNLTYQECLGMIQIFELNLDDEMVFQQTHNTNQLVKQYQMKKRLPKEEFLLWMSDNADLFKGYSKTTLSYLETYRKLILKYVRSDAKERLDALLAETDYRNWIKKRRGKNDNQKELIKKYVSNNQKGRKYNISENLGKNILELSKIAYSELEANVKLLTEVFSVTEYVKRTSYGGAFEHIRGMTGKYLSDLFNIPMQKERAIRTAQARRVLASLPDDQPCPEWIRQLGNQYTRGREQFQRVDEAKAWVEEYMREHRRRCLLVQRGDILPMVLYVSQQRYLQEIDCQMEDYKAEDAKKVFVELANSTLSACNMALLGEEFELDVMLMACFQEDEMYSYSDVLDVSLCDDGECAGVGNGGR